MGDLQQLDLPLDLQQLDLQQLDLQQLDLLLDLQQLDPLLDLQPLDLPLLIPQQLPLPQPLLLPLLPLNLLRPMTLLQLLWLLLLPWQGTGLQLSATALHLSVMKERTELALPLCLFLPFSCLQSLPAFCSMFA